MTQSPTRQKSSLVRTFLALPLPFLLAWTAISSLSNYIAVPTFFGQWSAMTKFAVTFIVLFTGILLYQILLHFWIKWIDPDGLGKRDRLLSDEIDNLGFLGVLVAIMAYMPFGKELDLSFGIIGVCCAAWFVAVTAIAALVRLREKSALSRKDVASPSVRDA